MPKVILISGGSDGLGKETARLLSSSNQVIILARDEEKLKVVSGALGIDYVAADVSVYAQVETAIAKVIERYGRIDVLINCAGVWAQGQITDNSPEEIENLLDVNTKGTIFLCRAVIPYMKKQGNGEIINIISQDGLTEKENRSLYHASKWAITGFTKCLQKDLSPQNVKVTGIYPGLMNTGLFEKHGVERDLTHALDLAQVAKTIEFVIHLSPDTLIPEIGIKHLLNIDSDMDNTSSGLDLNLDPNLITTQGGPQAITPANQTPPIPAVPPAPLVDITPMPASAAPVIPVEPPTPTSVSVSPAPTAPSSTPVPETPLTHLTPLEPAPTISSPTMPLTSEEPSQPQMPPQPAPFSPPAAPVTPELAAPVAPSAPPSAEFTIDTSSPLYENPDDVKLGQ